MSISTVTSEALQLKIRQLLPSQQGFATDLSASDTIIPIIDLTAAAEGSDVPQYLQTALAFGSQTSFSANDATVVVANTPGFYRITGVLTCQHIASGAANEASLTLGDGATVKVLTKLTVDSSGVSNSALYASESFDFTVFLTTGEDISAVSSNFRAFVVGSSRQVADTNGTLVQPSGFTPQ